MNLENLPFQANFKAMFQLKRRKSPGAAVGLKITQSFFSDSTPVNACISTLIATYVLLDRYFNKTV